MLRCLAILLDCFLVRQLHAMRPNGPAAFPHIGDDGADVIAMQPAGAFTRGVDNMSGSMGRSNATLNVTVSSKTSHAALSAPSANLGKLVNNSSAVIKNPRGEDMQHSQVPLAASGNSVVVNSSADKSKINRTRFPQIVMGLLELLHAGRSLPPDKKTNSDTAKTGKAASKTDSATSNKVTIAVTLRHFDLIIFYSMLYGLALAVFLLFRYQPIFKAHLSRVMRQVAMFYWRHPRWSSIGATCVLFLLADILGQGPNDDQGHLVWKLALILATALYNAAWHHTYYSWLDRVLEGGHDDWRSAFRRLATMMVLHLVIYLPVGVPFFLLTSDFLHRTFFEAESNCLSSAIAALPQNIGDATSLAAELLPDSYGWSAFFWPLSNLINFTAVQVWSPAFKPTWDGLVAVLWNFYALATSGAPVAVGPVLTDRSAIAKELKKSEPAADCSRTTIFAICQDIFLLILFILKIMWRGICLLFEFVYWCLRHFRYDSWLSKCYLSRKLWELWCIGCFAVRNMYIAAWWTASWSCTIVWRILMIPFQLFDYIKWYILMPVPRLWNYDACPCPDHKFDKSWYTGVIWEGSLLFVK